MAKTVYSCPKCYSVKVEVTNRMGFCLNPNCLHKGTKNSFRGLNGSFKASNDSEFLIHGSHKKPMRYE